MSIEVKVPQLPESVSDATLVSWHFSPGDRVERDQNLVDLETDKVVLEVPAPASGVLKEIKAEDGATVTAGDLLAILEEGEGAEEKEGGDGKKAKKEAKKEAGDEASEEQDREDKDETEDGDGDEDRDEDRDGDEDGGEDEAAGKGRSAHKLSPSVRRLVEKHDLDASKIEGSGKDGRITKSDVMEHIEGRGRRATEQAVEKRETEKPAQREGAGARPSGGRNERRVPMTRLRARIAERLVEAQRTAAMLTSFNEVDLGEVQRLRKIYRERFEKEHGVRLGFMSFFVKAAVEALRRFPVVNASVEAGDIVYHDYYDIGIAVSTERGLMVPVLRNAESMGFGEIESTITDYAGRAREGKIGIEELTGGTFTITNGGVFGSLISTPIINPPQSAILGMHKIQDRPMVVDGEVRVRPMMYIALTYDHRIIDGREAVQFLVAVKESLEDPARLLLRV